MEMIKSAEAVPGKNSDDCKTLEYSFKDKEMDLGIATITNRFPEEGYCINLICKELIYVLEGNGKLVFEDKTVSFAKGDAILIDKNEKYYYDTEYCVISMSCTPAWSPDQHKLVK